MSRRGRAVTPESLENPENGIELETREPDEATDEPGSEERLRTRIVALRAAPPDHSGAYCRACFRRGVMTLLGVIDVERHDVHDQVAALQGIYPPDPDPHSAHSYRGGVEAALRALAD
jgi:hypothetical protein